MSTEYISKLTLFLLLLPFFLIASDGNQAIGYGMKSKGMGGVGVAFPQDAVINAINPAGMAFLETRYDIGPHYVKFLGKGRISGNAVPTLNQSFHANMDIFLIDAGYVNQVTPKFSAGFSFYQRGATLNYGKTIRLLGTSKFLDLYTIAILTPAIAWKITPNHSIGIGIDVSLGRFKMQGFQNQKAISVAPDHVTNKKSDYRPGVGVKIGWCGYLTPCLSAGVVYTSEMVFHRYKKYKGLIPNRGDGNLPAQVSGGIAYFFAKDWVFSFDARRIFWSKTRIFGNKLTTTHLFGSKQGTGLGWKDQTVYKLGLAYTYNENLTFRIGTSLATTLFPGSQTSNNIIADICAKDHVTAGVTWTDGCQELTFAYIHAFEKTIKGNSIPPTAGGGSVSLSAREDWVGISYGQIY